VAPVKPTRREAVQVLGWSALGGYVALATGCKSRRDDAPGAPAPAGLRALTAGEFATMAAVAECIFPRDHDPGANDLGVPAYIDRALADHHDDEFRASIQDGLARLDADAVREHGHAFHQLAQAQDGFLRGWTVRARANQVFFAHAVRLTLEGAFGAPSHGGNKDGAGWRLLGFDGDPCAT
jgi:gluconate 2-dehydrogenase gamma chain